MQTASKAPSATELWQQWWSAGEKQVTELWRPWLDYLGSAPWPSSSSKHREHEDCGCGDPCRCCIPAAEIVVHARAGERRIIPFELHNRTHRPKEVTAAVGPWTPCDGPRLEFLADFDVSEKFTLGPCESKIVRLLVGVGAAEQKAERRPTFHDVETCASAYTDVRFDGCARPIRVAVVVHPTECDAYEVTCDCGCC